MDGVIVGVDTWNEEIFQSAPKLKCLARFGVGVDNIDLNAAKKYGVIVCNSPGINSSAVEEQAVALLFSLMRQVPQLNQAVRRGEWTRPMFHELKTRTVGFLGFGAIAREFAGRLKGFHPNLIAYDKYPNRDEAKRLGVQMLSLNEVLRKSDIISIHLPAFEETKHLICKENIQKMKSGVFLINTARGSIVNEKDVAEAMKEGKIRGFGTDVFEKEPIDISEKLFQFENYIVIPHVSAETYENCETTSIVTAKALISVFEGKEPDHRLV